MNGRGFAVSSLLLAFAAAPAAVFAQSPADLPALTQPVNDFAHVIDAESAKALDGRIRDLKAATGNVIVVATVPTYAPFGSIEQYAVKLFEKAGIGNRALDNGVLIVVAVKEHGVRIEVGYGLEGTITDGFAGETIRNRIAPAFKQGRFGAGLVAGVGSLAARVTDARQPTSGERPAAKRGPRWPIVAAVVLTAAGALILGLVLLVLFLRRSRDGASSAAAPRAPAPPPDGAGFSWTSPVDSGPADSASSSSSSSASPDSGSSFGGFDGGSSGGGGASGSW